MIYHEYETIYVTRPELPEAEAERLEKRFLGVIEQGQGSLLIKEDWGRRKLAYPVKKHAHGHYIYLNYVGPSPLVGELERVLRLEDNLIRFLTVKLDEDVDPEERRLVAEERHRRRAEKLAQEDSLDSDDDEDDDDEDTADKDVGHDDDAD